MAKLTLAELVEKIDEYRSRQQQVQKSEYRWQSMNDGRHTEEQRQAALRHLNVDKAMLADVGDEIISEFDEDDDL